MKKLFTLFIIFACIQIGKGQALSGDYYIPQGVNPQGFATLNAAVTSLNANGASGTVNFILDADILSETSFTFSAALSSENNVIVKPAPGRNVILNVTSSASVGNGPFMIGFTKGFVTFDGSNNGTTSRNLTISTEQLVPVVDLPFSLNHADADNVVLKNLIIKNTVEGQTNFRYGAVINDLGGVTGFRLENCQIGTALRPVRRDGVAPWGGGAVANQFSIISNEIYCGTRGVATIYLTNSEIIGNTINILPTTAAATDAFNHGIYITGQVGTLDISKNTINCLEKTVNASAYIIGIAFAGNNSLETDIITIANNMINVGAANETRYAYGIGMRSSQHMGNLKIYYNTILLNNTSSAFASHTVGNHTNGTGAVNIDLKNNILINNHSGNSGSSAIGLIPATSVLTSNYNLLLSNQNLVNYQGTSYANLTAWKATSQDANSSSAAVAFVSASDLHLDVASLPNYNLVGTPLGGFTTDFDGETRNVTYPYMGADENLANGLPVELTSFSATANGNKIELRWNTATEVNNYGFDVERSVAGTWTKLGFVEGAGNSNAPRSYSFVDGSAQGAVQYRLKQIDRDGQFTYSSVVEVMIANVAERYELAQNFPNPFNPVTTIRFAVMNNEHATVKVYDIAGREVATLFNDVAQPGQMYNVQFNATGLASGIYFYVLQTPNVREVKKMQLLK